jgi:hypothetical protein
MPIRAGRQIQLRHQQLQAGRFPEQVGWEFLMLMRILDFLPLIDHFQGVLIEAQKHRDERQDLVHGELGWVVFERETMFAAVNKKRVEFNLPTITLEHLKRVEAQAVGHTDFTHKFALYCAEISIWVEEKSHT